MAEKDPLITASSAAMVEGTGLKGFGEKFPERLFDVGIAEQHAVTFCAGLAASGMKPVFAVYSTFLQRGYDQIIHDVCLQELPVIFAIDRAGIVGADGETHQGIFDIAYLMPVSNINITAPRNGAELEALLQFALNSGEAFAIRYPRSSIPDDGYTNIPEIKKGKAELIKKGEKIAIISCGSMFETCMEVCESLEKDGFNPMVYNARFLKPMDEEMIKNCCENCDYIFTVEDGIRPGGFGNAVIEKIADLGYKNKIIHNFGFENSFIEHGTREELFERYKLDSKGILEKIRTFIS